MKIQVVKFMLGDLPIYRDHLLTLNLIPGLHALEKIMLIYI